MIQALCAAEDETDVQAAKIVAADQKAEMAEFDENIPWDEKESEAKKERDEEMSKVEQELAMIQKEVSYKCFYSSNEVNSPRPRVILKSYLRISNIELCKKIGSQAQYKKQ